MEYRRYGQDITLEIRSEAEKTINKNLRYKQIIDILRDHPQGLTAKQVSMQMAYRGYTSNTDRQNSAPRLTELSQKGIVEPIGKTTCYFTGKTVAVYGLREVE